MLNQFKCLPFCNKINNFSFNKRYNFSMRQNMFSSFDQYCHNVLIFGKLNVFGFSRKNMVLHLTTIPCFKIHLYFWTAHSVPRLYLNSTLSHLPRVVYFDQQMGASHAICCVKSFLGHFNTFFSSQTGKIRKSAKIWKKYFLR